MACSVAFSALALGSLFAMAAHAPPGSETPSPAASPGSGVTSSRVDHILLGVADLDRGVAAMAKLTGVRPIYGGKHPGGTHNALLSLGGQTYLEIIAVQPGATAPPGFTLLGGYDNPTPVGFAVGGGDLAALRAALAKAGFAVTPPRPGSRATPAGATLRWQTFGLAEEVEQAPFFIVWDSDTPHPATTSPAGCTLRQLQVGSPHQEPLRRLQAALGLPIEVVKATSPTYALTLECPKGTVVFRNP
ncbi:MAG TPA: VOC family protein [Thermoanaerobaculia bacterium]|jgi:hypothetical protein|nr:VOC family protein [Thermoanaerobaculia bacterium]